MSSDNLKKVVVTGAGGFLGSNLVQVLNDKEEYFVYALSSRGDELQRTNTRLNMQYCHKDAIFSDEGVQILKDAIVVNCAFPRNSTGTEMAEGLRYILRLFDRAKECGAKAIINISSQSVYSQTREEPATEEAPVCLESPYAVGKYATELMLESVCKETDIVYTNLRMASLIGPGFDQRIVNRFVKQALKLESITISKSAQKFGFLDVRDAVNGIIAILEGSPDHWKNIYNVGNAKDYTLETIIHCIKHVFDTARLHFPPVIVVEERWEKRTTAVDFKRLHTDTGYIPTIDLAESIRWILDDYPK